MLLKTSKPVYFLISTGILFALISWHYTENELYQRLKSKFTAEMERNYLILKTKLEIKEQTLLSITSLYNVKDTVSKKDFKKFVDPILKNNTFIQALEWIPRINSKDKLNYEKNFQNIHNTSSGFTERNQQMEMVPVKSREEYYPVYFVEPYKSNEAALGFDLGSNSTRLASLKQARDTGKTVATAKITLVQEEQKQSGFLVFAPIYKQKPTDLNSRKENLAGFALGVYRVGNMIKKIIQPYLQDGINVVIFDNTDNSMQKIFGDEPKDIKFTKQNNLDVSGRNWIIRWHGDKSFSSKYNSLVPLLISASILGLFSLPHTSTSCDMHEQRF